MHQGVPLLAAEKWIVDVEGGTACLYSIRPFHSEQC
jgi:hypothetical protein